MRLYAVIITFVCMGLIAVSVSLGLKLRHRPENIVADPIISDLAAELNGKTIDLSIANKRLETCEYMRQEYWDELGMMAELACLYRHDNGYANTDECIRKQVEAVDGWETQKRREAAKP